MRRFLVSLGVVILLLFGVFGAHAEDPPAKAVRFGKLIDMRITVEGNHVYLNFEYTTEDAAGQNMVTFATQAICEHIEAESPVKPKYWFLEANLSGDKKASEKNGKLRGRAVSSMTCRWP